ncbi:MAG: hypothetical protein P1U65_07715 [Minwuia sp.]|nr:hypothetical protein [Minwuia sp.]
MTDAQTVTPMADPVPRTRAVTASTAPNTRPGPALDGTGPVTPPPVTTPPVTTPPGTLTEQDPTHPTWPSRADDWIHTGTFMPTASGRIWPYLTATEQDVHWPDIAAHLSRIPRFMGATDGGCYSVAQHSVAVMQLASPAARPWALLHDAHEAFVGDMLTPIKRALRIRAAYTAETINMHWYHGETILNAALEHLRDVADRAIFGRVGIVPLATAPLAIRQDVARADRIMLAREAQWLLPDGPAMDAWATFDRALFEIDRGPQIEPLHPDAAAALFLHHLQQVIPTTRIDMEGQA